MKTVFIYLIGLYRRYLSPFLPPACRFTPTCSEYALEAFKRKNVVSALWLTVVRLAKCHPFHPGGYDPVDPDRTDDIGDGTSCPMCSHHRQS